MKDTLDKLQDMRRTAGSDFALYWALCVAIDTYLGIDIEESARFCQAAKLRKSKK